MMIKMLGEFTPLTLTLIVILGIYTFVIIAALIQRRVSNRGQIIRKRVPTHRTDERLLHQQQNSKKFVELDLAAVSGDAVEVIADEMFPKDGIPHSYIKHGVIVPSKLARGDDGKPALVVDVGANVGLFGVSMKYMCDVEVATRPKLAPMNLSAASPAPKRASSGRATSASRKTTAKTPSTTTKKAAAAAANKNSNNNNVDPNYTPPSVRVVGFEPIPETFECARRNYETYFGESNKACIAAGHPEHASKVLQIGIGQKKETLTFHYDPAFSAMASMAKAEISAVVKTAPLQLIGGILQDARNFKVNRLDGPGFVNDFILRPIYWSIGAYGTLMRTPGLNLIGAVVLIPFAIAFILWRVFSMPPEKTTECVIEPLPAALKRVGADDPAVSIAMLKVDVEGAEEQVLMGMDDVTWARVHQCVVEIHQTPDDRVGRLCALLREKGFKRVFVDVEELATHQVCELKTVFATRG